MSSTLEFYKRRFAPFSRVSSPPTASELKAEEMAPPKPGEKCALCGQVKPESAEDQVVARTLRIIKLCATAELSLSHFPALMRAEPAGSYLAAFERLPAPKLKTALLQLASADVWDDVIAKQNRALGHPEQ